MPNPQIGPLDKVSLSQNAALSLAPNGEVILLSGQTDSYLSLHGVSFTLD